MTPLERAYSPSSCVDNLDEVLQDFVGQCARASREYAKNLRENIAYGPSARTVMDIYKPDGDGPFPVHVFIHGGYWQEFSKRESNFAAGNFLNHNCILVVMDYTLAPQAKLAQIIAEARAGLLWVLQNIERFGGDAANVTASGHSAGAHLLAEVIAMDWKSEGFSACPLKGALLVSGVYDLRPLVDTYINDALGMDEAQASAASPLLHLPKSACPMVFTVGEHETDAFKQQTADYRAALSAKGIDSTYIPMTGFNHFDIILELANANSALFGAVMVQQA